MPGTAYKSAETAPAYGVMLVTGYASVSGVQVLTIEKPTTTFGTFIINDKSDVAVDAVGTAFDGPVVKALYDSGDTPTIGQVYGISGWKLKADGYRLLNAEILGLIDATAKTAFVHVEPITDIHAKAPSGGIPPRVGTLEGSESCELWTNSPTTQQISLSGITVTLYNWATSVVAATGDRHVTASWINGRWKATGEDCNDTGTTMDAASLSLTSGDPTGPTDTNLTAGALSIVGRTITFTNGGTPVP